MLEDKVIQELKDFFIEIYCRKTLNALESLKSDETLEKLSELYERLGFPVEVLFNDTTEISTKLIEMLPNNKTVNQ